MILSQNLLNITSVTLDWSQPSHKLSVPPGFKRKELHSTLLVGFPGGSAGRESACNARELGSIPGKIPWRRERLPTPVFWPGEFHGQSMGSQIVRHD